MMAFEDGGEAVGGRVIMQGLGSNVLRRSGLLLGRFWVGG